MAGVARLPPPKWSAPGTELTHRTDSTGRGKVFRTQTLLRFLRYLAGFMPHLQAYRRIDAYLMRRTGKGIDDEGLGRPLSECLMPEQCVQLQLPLISLRQIGAQGPLI